MLECLALKEKFTNMQFNEVVKENTLKTVSEFFDNKITIPMQKGNIIPEELIETYINSIKACANNVFEFDICINPLAEKVSPLVVPEEEYIPSVHSSKKILDNSDATLIAEFALGYDDAKEYAERIKRKVKRVHWEKPAVIRIYTRL